MNQQQRHEHLVETLGQLKSVVEDGLMEVREHIAQLVESVRQHAEEIGVLRDALDELRETLDCASRNHLPVTRVTSMPLDPASGNWAEELNRFDARDLLRAQATIATQQLDLLDDKEAPSQ